MADFKQIAAYFDQLHKDIGQLMLLIEKLMGEAGYASLPSSGNRASWRITSHLERPEGWRAPYLTRCYVLEGEDEVFTESLIILIVLETDTIYDFPPLICARISHSSLTEKEIYNQVFLLEYLKTLATSRPSWRYLRKEQGWLVAEPTFRTPTNLIYAYILNLFEISDSQKVVDNIITPLLEGGDLTKTLTLSAYTPGEVPL